jgi:hypothetical protein
VKRDKRVELVVICSDDCAIEAACQCQAKSIRERAIVVPPSRRRQAGRLHHKQTTSLVQLAKKQLCTHVSVTRAPWFGQHLLDNLGPWFIVEKGNQGASIEDIIHAFVPRMRRSSRSLSA